MVPSGRSVGSATHATQVTTLSRVSPQATVFSLDASAAERAKRGEAELDQRLDYMMRRPGMFSAEFANYSIAEQEIWLRYLAERALELGRGPQVLRGLKVRDVRKGFSQDDQKAA